MAIGVVDWYYQCTDHRNRGLPSGVCSAGRGHEGGTSTQWMGVRACCLMGLAEDLISGETTLLNPNDVRRDAEDRMFRGPHERAANELRFVVKAYEQRLVKQTRLTLLFIERMVELNGEDASRLRSALAELLAPVFQRSADDLADVSR